MDAVVLTWRPTNILSIALMMIIIVIVFSAGAKIVSSIKGRNDGAT